MNDELRFQCGEILKHYGEEHQQEKAIEEMAELIAAIKHEDRSNYVEELADVQVMIEQLFQALSFKEQQQFIVTIHNKIDRQINRIHKEKAEEMVGGQNDDSENTGKSLCNLWKHNS